MTDKMREEFEKWHMSQYGGFGLSRDTEPGYTHQYERSGTQLQWTAWQAAQSVPVVGEPVVNQCDGCCRGLMVDDDGMHRAESGHPVMVCERPVYDAAELERLRKCEAVLVHVRSVLPMDKWADDSRRMIDAAIAAEGEK